MQQSQEKVFPKRGMYRQVRQPTLLPRRATYAVRGRAPDQPNDILRRRIQRDYARRKRANHPFDAIHAMRRYTRILQPLLRERGN